MAKRNKNRNKGQIKVMSYYKACYVPHLKYKILINTTV